MLLTIEELRQFVNTDETDSALEFRIRALESMIKTYTNNQFKDGFPADVKLGAIDILRWQIQNVEKNGTDTSKKDIASETISRHSVTYATDATESDISEDFGVPKKYVAFLHMYMKARF